MTTVKNRSRNGLQGQLLRFRETSVGNKDERIFCQDKDWQKGNQEKKRKTAHQAAQKVKL
jgi:hypothetical protein